MTFTVTPRKVGYVPIKITARCAIAGDAVEQLLLVEAMGTPIFINKAVMLTMRNENSRTVNFTIETPDVAISDLLPANVSVFGDILGNTVLNLDGLIRVPTGCGEQNLIAFVPNLIVITYLEAIQNLVPTTRHRIISNLQAGYVNQLRYQKGDGSFSLWTNTQSSCWLTALVLRYFPDAKKYIYIDDNAMNRGLQWLSRQQAANGQFNEPGNCHYCSYVCIYFKIG
jgi:CD109 antigen